MSTRPTILCIDDKEPNLLIRAKLLEVRGYNVIIANDDSSALKAVKEQQVDLAVIDYHMERGANGEQIAKALRVMYPNLPLLLLTGDPFVPQSARDSVDACLIKGIHPATTLLNVIEKLLSQSRAAYLAITGDYTHKPKQ
ncbi:MAG TPA: response regulator [Candidatus Angelobacter sp.]|nr:response regulator [Candidatus Angelobacter sp.]